MTRIDAALTREFALVAHAIQRAIGLTSYRLAFILGLTTGASLVLGMLDWWWPTLLAVTFNSPWWWLLWIGASTGFVSLMTLLDAADRKCGDDRLPVEAMRLIDRRSAPAFRVLLFVVLVGLWTITGWAAVAGGLSTLDALYATGMGAIGAIEYLSTTIPLPRGPSKCSELLASVRSGLSARRFSPAGAHK